MASSMAEDGLTCRPLVLDLWADFETLFGRNGACGGCWCMLWRLPRRQFEAQKGASNKAEMKRLVNAGEVPGLLAYAGGRAVGWCAVAPRECYPALERSRILKPLDDRPCWSVSCLFVHRAFRMQGVGTRLLCAAAGFARDRGASLIEGYPVEPAEGRTLPAAFAWTGVPSAFERAGFREAARRSPARPVMRRELRSGDQDHTPA